MAAVCALRNPLPPPRRSPAYVLPAGLVVCVPTFGNRKPIVHTIRLVGTLPQTRAELLPTVRMQGAARGAD